MSYMKKRKSSSHYRDFPLKMQSRWSLLDDKKEVFAMVSRTNKPQQSAYPD